MAAKQVAAVDLRLLGELEVSRAGRKVPLPASKKTRALLGYLVANAGPHLRERLCDLLWQGPDDPRAALRWSLTKLRALFDEDRIVADRQIEATAYGVNADDIFDFRPGHRAYPGRGPGAEQQATPTQRREPAGDHPGTGHAVGFQWKVKVALYGFSHTSWYSTWRAETGGETSRVSW